MLSVSNTSAEQGERASLLEANGLHRFYPMDVEGRDQQGESGHDHHKGIHKEEKGGIPANRHNSQVVFGFIELEESGFLLEGTQGQGQSVTPEHAPEEHTQGEPDEDEPDRPVVRPQGFQDADHIHPFQDEDKQDSSQVDHGHQQHQDKQHLFVNILQVHPVEDGGKFLPDSFDVQLGRKVVVIEVIGDGIGIPQVINKDLKAANGIGRPSGEFLEVTNIDQCEFAIVFFQPGFIDTAYFESAFHLPFLLDKMHNEVRTHFELHPIGRGTGNEDIPTCQAIGQGQWQPFFEIGRKEGPVKISAYAFKQYPFQLLLAGEDTGFEAKGLDMPYSAVGLSLHHPAPWSFFQVPELVKRIKSGVKWLIEGDRRRLKGVIQIESGNLHVSPEPEDLGFDFFLKTQDEGMSEQNHRHTERDRPDGEADNHPGEGIGVSRAQPTGNKGGQIHIRISAPRYGPLYKWP